MFQALDEGSDLVYKFLAPIAPSCIGETSQTLKKRVPKHKSEVDLKNNSTGLTNHSLDMGHNFDSENTSIVLRRLRE